MFSKTIQIKKKISSLVKIDMDFAKSIFDNITHRIIIPNNLKYLFNSQFSWQLRVGLQIKNLAQYL